MYRWQNHVDLSSFIAQLHMKIGKLFSSCNPRELPLCVSLSFLPSAKIYGYGHCFCRGSFVPGGCRCLPHTEIKPQDSHTIREAKDCGLWTLETQYWRLVINTVEVFCEVKGILKMAGFFSIQYGRFNQHPFGCVIRTPPLDLLGLKL